MKQMSLSAKIIGGFAVVLVMMACAIGIYQYSSSHASSGAERLVNLQFEATIAAGQIQKAMLEARRGEKDFILRSDMKYVEKNGASVKKLLQETERLIAIETEEGDQEMVDLGQKIIEHANAYDGFFKEYVAAAQTAGLTHKLGLQGKFRDAAHGIQDSVKAAGSMDLLAVMLDCRKHEKDFMLRSDKKYVKKLHASADKLAAMLDSDANKEKLIVYTKGFDALVAAYDDMDAAKAKMRDAVHQIEPEADKLLNSLVEEAHAESNAVAAQTARFAKIALVVALCAILAGCIMALLLARSLSRPILQSVEGLTMGAEQVSAAAGQVSSSSQTLAEGATEQAAALEETSASMEEIASMTKHNADNSMEADSLMKSAIEIIKKADLAMDEMSVSMKGISEASEETSKIVKTIDEIAFQTNLLALNAAVEAARAGEAGAGFAVVADEVRNLAMRAAEAARNTSELIEGTVQKVASGTEIVDKTNEAFKEVTDYGSKIGSLVAEIAVASREQATGVSQVTEAIAQMDTVTQQNSASSEESAAAAEELNAQAETMMDVVRGLRSIVEGGGSPRRTISRKKTAAATLKPQSSPRSTGKVAALPAATKATRPTPGPGAAASAPKKVTEPDPEDIIPMDDDDDFEDF